MPLCLVRIDDRLIHGQVVLGWARALKPDRIVVANDRVAGNTWERKFFTSSVPSHIRVSFLDLEEIARQLLNNLFKNELVMILFESVRDVCAVGQTQRTSDRPGHPREHPAGDQFARRLTGESPLTTVPRRVI